MECPSQVMDGEGAEMDSVKLKHKNDLLIEKKIEQLRLENQNLRLQTELMESQSLQSGAIKNDLGSGCGGDGDGKDLTQQKQGQSKIKKSSEKRNDTVYIASKFVYKVKLCD